MENSGITGDEYRGRIPSESDSEDKKQKNEEKRDNSKNPAGKKPEIIPISKKFKKDSIRNLTPESVFRTFRNNAPFILESAYGEDKSAEYSLIGVNPVLRVKAESSGILQISGQENYIRAIKSAYHGENFSILPGDNDDHYGISDFFKSFTGDAGLCRKTDYILLNEPDPAEKIHQIMDLFEYHKGDIPGYQGGLTGYFSYDLVYSLFKTVKTNKPESDFPTADFIMTSEYILFDHPAGEVYIFSPALAENDSEREKSVPDAEERIREIYERLKQSEDLTHGKSGNPDRTRDTQTSGTTYDKDFTLKYSENISGYEFEELVRETKDYITSGDIFQGVISKRNTCSYNGDPYLIYSELRRINPGPYMYYINYGERQVIGSSPEMLVKVEDRKVTTVPIAGTVRRGKDPEEDKILGDKMLSDEKERAEHVMLVDLARNDIGRVSRYGTVSVDEFMKIEKFSHVQHIVSTVSGELKDGLNASDAFRSVFPAGTLTGAPKVRAMQIIDELETDRRGLYGGAVGHIGLDKKTDFAIAIRTLVCENEILTFQAGAGIVAGSVPESEYREAEKKASALAAAINNSKGGFSA